MKIFTFVTMWSLIIGLPAFAQSQSTSVNLSSESTVTSSSSSSGTGETDSSARGNVETEFKVEEAETAAAEKKGTKGKIEATYKVEEGKARVGTEGDLTAPEAPQESVSGYVKLDGVKGESNGVIDPDDDGDSISTGVDLETRAIYVKFGDIKGESNDSGSSARKPKEIVVVGSKVREAVAAGVQVRGWNPDKKRPTLLATNVQSEDDLIDFSAGLLAVDATLSNIEIAESSIGVEGTHKAKLFGLFNVAMKYNIDVAADPDSAGRVKVRFPWWSFLTKTSVSADEIKASVEAKLATEVEVSSEVFKQEFGTDQNNPRRYQILGTILEASATASLNASVQ